MGLKATQIDEMYKIMAIANYEDRFVIPTAHRELGADAYDMRGSCGFTFGNGCSGGESEVNLFGSPVRQELPWSCVMKTFKVLSALLTYPSQDLIRRRRFAGCWIRKTSCLPPSGCTDGLIGKSQPVSFMIFRSAMACCSTGRAPGVASVRTRSRRKPRSKSGDGRLKTLYENSGFAIAANELPDFVPLFLEFLSIAAGGGCA